MDPILELENLGDLFRGIGVGSSPIHVTSFELESLFEIDAESELCEAGVQSEQFGSGLSERDCHWVWIVTPGSAPAGYWRLREREVGDCDTPDFPHVVASDLLAEDLDYASLQFGRYAVRKGEAEVGKCIVG